MSYKKTAFTYGKYEKSWNNAKNRAMKCSLSKDIRPVRFESSWSV